jgi:hypothetical protein
MIPVHILMAEGSGPGPNPGGHPEPGSPNLKRGNGHCPLLWKIISFKQLEEDESMKQNSIFAPEFPFTPYLCPAFAGPRQAKTKFYSKWPPSFQKKPIYTGTN